MALDKAIRARLGGLPVNNLGLPADPVHNPGVRLPKFATTSNDITQATFNPFAPIPGQFRQVPVFKKSGAGRDWAEQYPAVVYDFVNIQQRADMWLAPVLQNKLSLQNNSPVREYKDRSGRVLASGQTSITEVPLPDPFDVMIQIECQSKIQFEALLMVQAVLAVFPTRGYITVPFACGLLHNCDMLLTDDITLAEDEDVALAGAGDAQADYREHRYILTYTVEAYLDTTDASHQVVTPTVQQVKTEVAFSGDLNADNVASTDAVAEVIDLTAQ